jgi:hypothetical protein
VPLNGLPNRFYFLPFSHAPSLRLTGLGSRAVEIEKAPLPESQGLPPIPDSAAVGGAGSPDCHLEGSEHSGRWKCPPASGNTYKSGSGSEATTKPRW